MPVGWSGWYLEVVCLVRGLFFVWMELGGLFSSPQFYFVQT